MRDSMRALVIQPPFVQLNAPYPAAWYLDAWLRSRGVASTAVDHSIELARLVFSRDGLARVFADARAALAGRRHPDAETARRVARYLEQEEAYLATMDGIAGFLSGGDPAFAYRLASGGGIPSGMRAEAVLGPAGGITPGDAGALATAILNDLADFIAYALDPGFGTVRYAERLARGATDFGTLKAEADSGWVPDTFYRPLLRDFFARQASTESASDAGGPGPDILVCLTAPFPGCMAGAIVAAEEARLVLGDRAVVLLGGGYVSTELRFLDDPAVFDVFDYLCYDAGYGALASVLDRLAGGDGGLYRTRHRSADGVVVATGFPGDEPCVRAAARSDPAGGGDRAGTGARYRARIEACPTAAAYEALERDALRGVHPDYAGVDFGRYLRVVDSPNPMHRLWNDTPWLKYRLAYGCYWKRCEFCDTELDYIKRHLPSNLDALLAAADAASARTGLYGLHFVDEAMPVNLVRAFAAANAGRRRPFTFWGNVRFDRSWTDEACRFAADRGLVAVAGGIEIATGEGLRMVDKGFSLPDLVRCLAAFKRSAVLVHAYLVYGFPGQSDQDIADSAETVRVLLAEGLVDSAFWHRFTLTRHSRMYAEWERGGRPSLSPKPPSGRFGVNDLEFAGEERYGRWSAPLDAALSAWADDGDTDRPLADFLPRGLPRPAIDAAAVLRDAGV